MTRLEVSARSVLLICSCCGHRSLHADRSSARVARAVHETSFHAIPARVSPAAAALRKARQRAREVA